MQKTILITGATDGIGLETARMLVSLGHNVLLHGRSPAKLENVESALSAIADGGQVDSHLADLSRLADVEALATAVAERNTNLEVLINNAGVYNTPDRLTQDGLDVRFAVNTIAPLSADKAAFAAAWKVRAGNQPVLRGPGAGRSGSTGRTCQAVRRHGLCPKQAGDYHVVTQVGDFAQR